MSEGKCTASCRPAPPAGQRQPVRQFARRGAPASCRLRLASRRTLLARGIRDCPGWAPARPVSPRVSDTLPKGCFRFASLEESPARCRRQPAGRRRSPWEEAQPVCAAARSTSPAPAKPPCFRPVPPGGWPASPLSSVSVVQLSSLPSDPATGSFNGLHPEIPGAQKIFSEIV